MDNINPCKYSWSNFWRVPNK